MIFPCVQCGACCRLVGESMQPVIRSVPGTTICDKLDQETNLCTIYEERPAICRIKEATPAAMGHVPWFALNLVSCLNFANQLGMKEKAQELVAIMNSQIALH